MGWHWHQLDHMQIICTLLQTDNHSSTSLLIFYRLDALLDAQPTVSKHWMQFAVCRIYCVVLSVHRTCTVPVKHVVSDTSTNIHYASPYWSCHPSGMDYSCSSADGVIRISAHCTSLSGTSNQCALYCINDASHRQWYNCYVQYLIVSHVWSVWSCNHMINRPLVSVLS